MIVELDVIIGESLWYVDLSHDRSPIDERTGVDQHFVDEQRVIWRDKKVAYWKLICQCPGFDADRQYSKRICKPQRDRLPTDPSHRHCPAVRGDDQIARPKIFYCRFASGRGDHCTRIKANGDLATAAPIARGCVASVGCPDDVQVVGLVVSGLNCQNPIINDGAGNVRIGKIDDASGLGKIDGAGKAR